MSILTDAFDGLLEYYPELSQKHIRDGIIERVSVPDTGNNQKDYESVRNQVENLVTSYIQDGRFIGSSGHE